MGGRSSQDNLLSSVLSSANSMIISAGGSGSADAGDWGDADTSEYAVGKKGFVIVGAR